MRKISILAFLLCISLFGLSQNDIKSFQCRFTEEKIISSLNESFVSEGSIRYSQKEIIFEYTSPEQLIIKKDSTNNISVLKDNEVVKTNAIHKQTINLIENIFKGDVKNQFQDFEIETSENEELDILVLTAKKNKARVESMELYFDKSNYNFINKIVIRETKGNIINISVSEHKIVE